MKPIRSDKERPAPATNPLAQWLRAQAAAFVAQAEAIERGHQSETITCPGLDRMDVAILRVLAAHPLHRVLAADLSDGGHRDIGRPKAVGIRLRQLHNSGFVDFPVGSHRGALITGRGLAAVRADDVQVTLK